MLWGNDHDQLEKPGKPGKLENLEKVLKLMEELDIDSWDVFSYVLIKDALSDGDPEEYLDRFVGAEDDPSLVKNLYADAHKYLAMIKSQEDYWGVCILIRAKYLALIFLGLTAQVSLKDVYLDLNMSLL